MQHTPRQVAGIKWLHIDSSETFDSEVLHCNTEVSIQLAAFKEVKNRDGSSLPDIVIHHSTIIAANCQDWYFIDDPYQSIVSYSELWSALRDSRLVCPEPTVRYTVELLLHGPVCYHTELS